MFRFWVFVLFRFWVFVWCFKFLMSSFRKTGNTGNTYTYNVDAVNRLKPKTSTDHWVWSSCFWLTFFMFKLFCFDFECLFDVSNFWCLVSEKQEILISYRSFDFKNWIRRKTTWINQVFTVILEIKTIS